MEMSSNANVRAKFLLYQQFKRKLGRLAKSDREPLRSQLLALQQDWHHAVIDYRQALLHIKSNE